MIRIGVIVAVVLIGACGDDVQPDDPIGTAPRDDRPVPIDEETTTTVDREQATTTDQPQPEPTRSGERPRPAPDVLTEADEGSYLLGIEGRTSVRLDPALRWETPTVSDRSVVEVSRVLAEEDPGYIEWAVEARERGEASIEFVNAQGTAVRFHFVVET